MGGQGWKRGTFNYPFCLVKENASISPPNHGGNAGLGRTVEIIEVNPPLHLTRKLTSLSIWLEIENIRTRP